MTFKDATRVIGRRYENIPTDDIERWPFKLINEKGLPKFEVQFQGKVQKISPEFIIAAIISKMKKTAEQFLSYAVTDAVITVPAWFNLAQCQAVKTAAEIAGLNVLRLMSSSTAATIAYGFNANILKNGEHNVLIFDLGAGTLDVSIISIDDDIHEVKAVGGDTNLGGLDFNNNLLDHFLQEIKLKFNLDLSKDKFAISQLLRECETAKIALSAASKVQVTVKGLLHGLDFKSSITKECFGNLNAKLFNKAMKIVEDTLKKARLRKSDIDEVILVGGSIRIPEIQQRLQEFFDGKRLNKSIIQDEAAALVVAIYASMLSKVSIPKLKDMLLIDVTPIAMGTNIAGDRMKVMIAGSTTIPTKQTGIYKTVVDEQTKILVKIYEGEHPVASKNHLLFQFVLEGLPRLPKGEAKIDVTFDVDADKSIIVHAICKQNGVEKTVKLEQFKHQLNMVDGDIEQDKEKAEEEELHKKEKFNSYRAKRKN